MPSYNYDYTLLTNTWMFQNSLNTTFDLNWLQSNNMSLDYFLLNHINLQICNLNGIHNITSLVGLFQGCYNLNNLTFSNCDFNCVTNLSQTFRGCSNLNNLNSIFSWCPSNITDLSETFRGCSKVNDLNLINWNLINITNLYNTFCYCKNLHNLDISSWNLSNVTNMKYTFGWCQWLTNSALLNIGKAISVINAWDKPFNNLYNNNSEGIFYMSYNWINASVLNATTILALRNNGWIFEGMNDPIVTYRLSYVDNMNQSGYVDFGRYNDLQNYIKTTDLVFSEISISDEEV